MPLRLFATFLLLAGLGCLCSGGDEETGDSHPSADTHDTGIPGGSFWGEYSTALCEHYQRCEPEFFDSFYKTMENCVATFTESFEAGAEAYEGCVFDETNGRLCILGIESGPCEGFEMPAGCQSLFYCPE